VILPPAVCDRNINIYSLLSFRKLHIEELDDVSEEIRLVYFTVIEILEVRFTIRRIQECLQIMPVPNYHSIRRTNLECEVSSSNLSNIGII